ncbi:MAG TPA: SMC family ATPase, partial [Vicinamibacteria bacterium]
MRPLRLTVEAFTCFKERQGPLDLSGLELFAIAGPTGAGKSSLLDAIIFALYGRVPRMRRGYSELISLGRDRMSVNLDFRVGLREFRIARIARRGRSGEAQLDELTGGGERSLAGGVQGVDEQVVRLLGLRYEAFTQAVVLPQGEFARFLKSQPRERREILRDLLRLQVYERMRRAAAESSRELEVRLGGVRERLSEDYAEVEPRQLSDLERSLKTLTKDHVKMSEELAALQRIVEDKRAAYRATRELSEKRARLAELVKRQGQIETSEKRLAAARKASPVLPLLEAALGAEQRAEADRRRSKESTDALRDHRAKHDEAADRLQAARRRADELPELTRKIQALDELKGLFGPRESATRRRDEARTRLGAIEPRIEAAKKEGLRACETVRELERDLEAITKRLDGLDYDAEKDRGLDQVRDRASALAAQREAVAEAAREASETRERASRERRIVSETKALVAKLRKALHAAARAREKAEAERRQAERAHAAEHLRRQLEAGGKCPVCGRAVERVPRAKSVTSLDEIASRLDEARASEERARSSMEKALEAEAEARASAKASEREVGAAERKAARLAESVERGERELEEAIGGTVRGERGANLEERIFSAIRRMTERREIHEQHLRQRVERESKIHDARRALDKHEQVSSTLREQLQEVQARAREAEEEVALL